MFREPVGSKVMVVFVSPQVDALPVFELVALSAIIARCGDSLLVCVSLVYVFGVPSGPSVVVAPRMVCQQSSLSWYNSMCSVA